jgi:hypothetical protein
MKNLLVTILFCLPMIFAIAQQAPTDPGGKGGASFPNGEQFKGANITYNIIPAANNTWCYDILMEGRLFIHQPTAPGLPGNEGFKTKEAAAKVAELVISKMKKGEMPPSITIEEMKNLKAL